MKWRRLMSSMGSPPGTRCASLPHAQDAPEAPAGPWDRRWTPPGRAGHDAAGSPNSVTKSPPALPQLVAIDDCALSARHVVEDAALDKHVYARVAEQDQRCTIIIAARIARDLPSLREQLFDRQRYLRCRQAGRRQHHCQEQGLRPREA